MAPKHTNTIVTAVVVLAGLAIGSAIDRQMPSTDDVFARPFIHEVEMGQIAKLRTAEVAVVGVETAQEVMNFGVAYSSVGTWVLLDIHVEATNKPLLLSEVELVSTSGNTYGGTADVPNNCEYAQPGIAMICQAAFEVATQDIPGLKARIPADSQAGAPGDDLAIIDLGIGDQSDLISNPQPLIEITRTRYEAAS